MAVSLSAACSLIAILSQLHLHVNEGCPKQLQQEWVQIYEGLCYSLHDERVGWYEARKGCSDRKGQLARMESQKLGYRLLDDNKYSKGGKMKPTMATSVWLGARKSNGKYYWTNGQEVQSNFWDIFSKTGTIMKSWFVKNRDLCMALKYFAYRNISRWVEEECNENRAFVCEYTALEINANTTADNFSLPPTAKPATVTPNANVVMVTSITNSTTVTLTENSSSAAPTTNRATTTPTLTTNWTGCSETTTAQPSKTASSEKPENRYMLRGISKIDGKIYPKLRATPNRQFTAHGSIFVCIRFCVRNPQCQLVNYFTRGECRLYFEKKLALVPGVDSEKGWCVWSF